MARQMRTEQGGIDPVPRLDIGYKPCSSSPLSAYTEASKGTIHPRYGTLAPQADDRAGAGLVLRASKDKDSDLHLYCDSIPAFNLNLALMAQVGVLLENDRAQPASTPKAQATVASENQLSLGGTAPHSCPAVPRCAALERCHCIGMLSGRNKQAASAQLFSRPVCLHAQCLTMQPSKQLWPDLDTTERNEHPQCPYSRPEAAHRVVQSLQYASGVGNDVVHQRHNATASDTPAGVLAIRGRDACTELEWCAQPTSINDDRAATCRLLEPERPPRPLPGLCSCDRSLRAAFGVGIP
eukprot:gene4739-864_t